MKPNLLIFAALLFCVPLPAQGATPDSASPTPEERITMNAQKVKEDPSLRGRWNVMARQPAPEGSYVNDNLALEILSNLRGDDEVSNLPVRLKVRSQSGVVTLEGVVNSDSERSIIQEKVSRMNGVKKVENKLRIKTSDKDLLEN